MPRAYALLLENVHASATEVLGEHDVEVRALPKGLKEDELIAALSDFPGDEPCMVGIRSKTHITPRVLESVPRLMAVGARHYGAIRAEAADWLARVEIAAGRIDDRPRQFSGGMQQRLQIARNLVTAPRLVFMDEPTGGLDVSVQARLLDLIRGLVRDMALSVVIVTHDLAVVRLLADRLLVMKDGRVIEAGLTDQVLDDPQEPYTQVLVSSVLQV